MLQPYLDRMVSKLATDCMAQRAHKFFYKDWYAQNYSYCYDYIIQLSTVMSQHPYIKGRRVLWWRIVKKHIHAGILCSAVLLAVLPSLGYTETVKDYSTLMLLPDTTVPE